MDADDGLLFNRLMRTHFNTCHALLVRRGLGDVGSPQLLHLLGTYPDDPAAAPTQRELADRLHISAATMTASLKSLERAGYVVRRTDERDSRRNRISITEKGRSTLEAGRRVFETVDDRMYRGFTPEERALVSRFHRRMLDNLCEISGRAGQNPCEERKGSSQC